MRAAMLAAVALLLVSSSAFAQGMERADNWVETRAVHDPWHIDWMAAADAAVAEAPRRALSLSPNPGGQAPAPPPLHAAAIEHSDGYLLRGRIHKIASFATLPLLAGELILGQSLYSATGDAEGTKGAHVIVGAGIGTLFMANTVTGVWNLFGTEGRRDTEGRKLRLVHGLLMMAADIGFVATTLAAPDGEGRSGASSADRSRHRSLAFASIGTGTVGYLVMLFGNR